MNYSRPNKINMLSLFKNFFRYFKKDKKMLIFGIFMSIGNALCYSIGTAFIGLTVKKFFPDPQFLFAHPESFDIKNFSIWMVILSSLFIMYTIFRIIQNKIFIFLTFKTAAKMKKEIMEKLLQMPISYYDKQKSGDLISIIVNDVNNMSNSLYRMLNEAFSNFIDFIFSAILMFLFSPLLTMIIIPISVIFYSLGGFMIKWARPHYIGLQDTFGELNAYVEEMLHNSKITSAYNQKKKVQNDFQTITNKIYKEAFIGDVISRLFEPWFQIANNTLLTLIVVLSVVFKSNNIFSWSLISFNSSFDYAFLITYIGLMYNYSGNVEGLLNVTLASQLGVASSSRVYKLLNLEVPKVIEKPTYINNLRGKIEFKNVNFKYRKKSTSYQLKNASFIAKPGETIAIVGPTGAGKTTIINILAKFYEYDSGSIKIDDCELKNITSGHLRDMIAIVLQDSFMFNDTIKNNLKLYNPNISDEQMIEAAKLTFAYDLIEKMPQSFDTIIGTSGDNLSQGEKQLLAITRAILGNKKIIVLDEATSHIDSNTEKIIQNSLMNIMKNKTSIVIAHRLSTIKNADKILVVNNGEIIEQGNHQELLNNNGFYTSLYKSQFDN